MKNEHEDEDDAAMAAADEAFDRVVDPRGMAIVRILLDRLEEWSADDFVGLPDSIKEGKPFDYVGPNARYLMAMVSPGDSRTHFVELEVRKAPAGLRWKVYLQRCAGPSPPFPARYPDDDDDSVAEAFLAALHHVCGRVDPDPDRPAPPEEEPAPRGSWKRPRGDRAFQVKATILGTEPPVWRRLVLPGRTRLDLLHRVLQTAFGWEESHGHLFAAGGRRYADPALGLGDDGERFRDERRTDFESATLGGAIPLEYEYDFGDRWRHLLEVEGVRVLGGRGPGRPRCTGGARACPVEDIGGPAGHARFVEALADREHPRHEEFLSWADCDFDPELFFPETADWKLERLLAEEEPRPHRKRGQSRQK